MERIPELELSGLDSFAHALWGNPQAVLKRDNRTGVDYIDLEEHFVAFQFLLGSAIQEYGKILVREEYHTALRELETNRYHGGAYVTGQPGIGKSLFLVYVLVVHLGQRRTVAWQLSTGTQFYVLFRESATLYHLDDRRPLLQFSPMWALVDSNDLVRIPAGIFYSLGDVRPIQAASPRESRYKGWSKYVGAECYVMDIWSESEIVDLAKLLNVDVARMAALAQAWGGVPRRLLRFLEMERGEIEAEYSDDAEMAVRNCRVTMSAIVQKNLVGEGPSKFYFYRPRKTATGIARRRTISTVPTPTLRRLLGKALRTQDNAIKLDFFRALSQSSETRQAAEYIYESWFHVYVIAAKSIQCHWLQGSDDVSSLIGKSVVIPSTLAAVEVAEPPYYWIAPKNFPGVDGALVLNEGIYAFQVTISPRHKTPLDGLQMLQEHLPVKLKDLAWKVVFVGGDSAEIERVARRWAGKLTFPTNDTVVPIAWSSVDPVLVYVPYMELREESDPDSRGYTNRSYQ